MGGIDTRYFPFFADLESRPCVVAGAGPAAEKRIRQLLKYGAEVIVFAAAPTEWMLEAEADGKFTIERRTFTPGDLGGAFLAVCASEDADVVQAMVAESESTGCFLNIVGDPLQSNFILPSITHRDPIQIAITSAGTAPELAKALRKRVEAQVSDSWGTWARLVAEVRGRARADLDEAACAMALVAVTDASVLERLEVGQQLSADEFLEFAQRHAASEADESADAEGVVADASDSTTDSPI